jgi:hypothetical protein
MRSPVPSADPEQFAAAIVTRMWRYVVAGGVGVVVSVVGGLVVSEPFGRAGIFVFVPGVIGLVLLWLAWRFRRWTRQMGGVLRMPGKPVMNVEVWFGDGGSVRFRDPPWSQPSAFAADAAAGLFWGGRSPGSAVLVITPEGATAALLSGGRSPT